MTILAKLAHYISNSRSPDFVIRPTSGKEYLRRWFVIPRNPVFNIYYHEIVRSDDDRALHDHPWFNISIILVGGYWEHTIAKGGVHHRKWRGAGTIKFRTAKAAHRLEVDGPCSTLFITGPRFRSWGFHCPEAGWRHWRTFTGGERGDTIGRGCD
jgi:hypothetical protein